MGAYPRAKSRLECLLNYFPKCDVRLSFQERSERGIDPRGAILEESE